MTAIFENNIQSVLQAVIWRWETRHPGMTMDINLCTLNVNTFYDGRNIVDTGTTRMLKLIGTTRGSLSVMVMLAMSIYLIYKFLTILQFKKVPLPWSMVY